MESLYIVIPAYNESDNIQKVTEDWYPVIEKYHGDGNSRLVVIDDGSKDDTLAVLQKLAGTRPMMEVLSKANGGHGPAVIYGYHYAVRQGADYIFQTDSDGQTLAAEFDRFWKLRKTYDVVLGKRPKRGDGAVRALVEKVLCMILRMYFGVSVPDANAPYRLMKREVLEKYLFMLPEDYNIPNVMLTTFFAYFHEKLIFVRISFRPRQGGRNSINLQKIMKIGWKAQTDFRKFRKKIKEM